MALYSLIVLMCR